MYLQYQKRISIEFHYKFQNNESKIGRKKKLEKKESCHGSKNWKMS